MRTLAILVLAALPAAAQGLRVSAGVNTRRASLDEQIVLSVTVAGSGAVNAAPKLPPLPDFEVYESGRSQNYTIVNGRMSSTITHTYVLNPRKPGRFTIPPIEVPGGGSTEAFDVEITAGPDPGPAAAPPAPGQPAPAPAPRPAPSAGQRRPAVFVTATTDKKRAYVNEQVTLVVRFHTAVPLMGSPQYQAPKLTGLMSEGLEGQGQGQTLFAGVPYQYSEMKSALFPVQAGRATVGSAMVAVQVPRGLGDDFFDRFFGMVATETRRLQTDPIAIEALPLPPGRPDDFSDVVGKLEVKASLDRAKVKAGEAVTLTVAVSGWGNVKGVPEPKRPDLPSARFFASESAFEQRASGDRVGGVKTFKTTLVPRVSGTLDIPGPSLSYFDPERQEYVRAKAAPLRLEVLPGDPNASLPLVAGGGSAPGVTAVAEDIAYLKAPGRRGSLGAALGAFGAAGPLHALPFGALLLALAADLRRRARERDPRSLRRREARAAALKRLAAAAALPDAERPRAAALLSESLVGYLGDVLDLPPAGLTKKAALERLAARARPETLERLKSAWEELDLLRFAPGAADHAENERLIKANRELVESLERELNA